MVNYTPNNWSVSIIPGALNGTLIYYNFTCIGTPTNSTPIYNATMIIPNITITLTIPTEIEIQEILGASYNLTSTNGFNFDSRSVYLNISSLFYSSPAKNITYPDIDSFNSSISGNWLLAAPNATGSYNASLIVTDNWGNILYSGIKTIEVTNDQPSINFVALIIIVMGFIYVASKE
jgi:hypothetical protein